MNEIRQYIPTFVEGVERETVEFNTDEELVNIPLVKNFMSEGFNHFAVSGNLLMAIYDDGFKWWTVGIIKDPEKVNLPKWNGGKILVMLDGKETVITKELAMKCGDVVTLKDGRKCTAIRSKS